METEKLCMKDEIRQDKREQSYEYGLHMRKP